MKSYILITKIFLSAFAFTQITHASDSSSSNSSDQTFGSQTTSAVAPHIADLVNRANVTSKNFLENADHTAEKFIGEMGELVRVYSSLSLNEKQDFRSLYLTTIHQRMEPLNQTANELIQAIQNEQQQLRSNEIAELLKTLSTGSFTLAAASFGGMALLGMAHDSVKWMNPRDLNVYKLSVNPNLDQIQRHHAVRASERLQAQRGLSRLALRFGGATVAFISLGVGLLSDSWRFRTETQELTLTQETKGRLLNQVVLYIEVLNAFEENFRLNLQTL